MAWQALGADIDFSIVRVVTVLVRIQGISWRTAAQSRAAAYLVTMTLTDRIEMSPRVMLGKPVLRGTRIPVELREFANRAVHYVRSLRGMPGIHIGCTASPSTTCRRPLPFASTSTTYSVPSPWRPAGSKIS